MMEGTYTLVVDDEASIRFFLEKTLARSGHTVETASSGEEALDCLKDTSFDLVMLDLKLGGRVDGLRVLEAVRWRWPETVVVILTAHGSLGSAMAAIREGVDGYLLKPVEPAELRQAVEEALERRRSLARTKEGKEERPLEHGPFSIDLKRHLVTLDGEPLELTPREFSLLVHLVQNAHRVVSPKELVRVVGQYEVEHMHEARQIVKWYIHRLRRKVEPDPSKPCYILNVRGVGYRFAE
jgi:two-component system alkaline phosphatase synthesis response regulator PhoP